MISSDEMAQKKSVKGSDQPTHRYYITIHLNLYMKTLPLNRTGPNDMVKVMCDGEKKEVSVYSKCAFCAYCEGVIVGRRDMPNPLKKVITDTGLSDDERVDKLQEAQLTFNLFVKDGNALLCGDDQDKGFQLLHSY
ncbi:MAG: hypothetical protein WC346_08700 [Methanogenium sp.]|jgi:hypothetical protein